MSAAETGTREDFERTPPHDLAAEQCVLGAMMLSRQAIADVEPVLRARDHYRPAHQIVHEAIIRLWDAGTPADIVTVRAELARRGEITKVGEAPYLHTLIASVPTAANAGYYARIVQRHAGQRDAIEAGTRIVQLGYTADCDARELADQARDIVDAISPVRADGVPSVNDLYYEVVGSLERAEARGLPLPWHDLNEVINGLAPGELDIIAGRPGAGKSLAGLNTVTELALRHDIPAVIFSMEMNPQEIMLRLIAAEGKIPHMSLVKRQLTDEHWRRIKVVQERITSAPLVIDGTPDCSLGHIRSRLRTMARSRAAGLVFVDYLQLMAEPGRAENRQAAVAGNSRGLKLIAGEFGIPVLAAAQLNRNSVHRADRRPELSDLRESGAIEGDASAVVLIHREGPDSPRFGEADFIVAKNRSGPQGVTVTLAFQGEYARIVGMSADDDGWSPSSPLRRVK